MNLINYLLAINEDTFKRACYIVCIPSLASGNGTKWGLSYNHHTNLNCGYDSSLKNLSLFWVNL